MEVFLKQKRGNQDGRGGIGEDRGVSTGDSQDELALRLLAVISQLTLKRALEIHELQAARFRVILIPVMAAAA